MDSVSFSLTPNFQCTDWGGLFPTSVHKPKWLQNEGENSKKRPLFVEGVFWLNFGVLIGCAHDLAKTLKW
jgi:hypothetical protein